jgi:hypothetical protein
VPGEVEDMPADDQSVTEVVNDLRRNVDVQTSNFSVRELARMVTEGELNISPEYQRLFRWPVESESRLIESLMLGLPVPSIFVATNEDFTLEVVDGLQRLSTLVHFLDPSPEALQAMAKEGPLELAGLETIEELNGFQYTTLPRELQLYFSRTTLQVTALTDKSDYDVRFELFDRLNAGSLKLTNQEVRNAVYRGPFVAFLHDLARDERFKRLLRLDDERLRDGTLEETVLKFFAYRHDVDKYRGPIKPFLNDFMSSHKDQFPSETYRSEFESAVAMLDSVIDGPYLREGYHSTPLVPFEAALLAAARLVEQEIDASPQDGWKEDTILRESSRGGHNTPGRLKQRVDRLEALLKGEPPAS